MKGVVIGAAIGATVQEVGAAFSDKHGLLDMLRGKGPVQGETMTGLAYLKHWFSGDLPQVSGSIVDHVAGYDFKIPDGMDLQENADGTLTLAANGQEVVKGLELDSTGHFTNASADALAKQGIHLSESDAAVAKTVMTAGNMDAKDFVHQNAGDMHEVSRDLWYGNDTPMYTDPLTGKLLGADHNELRLLWGGDGATGIDADGNFVFDVSEMTKNGSWQGFTRPMHNGFCRMGRCVCSSRSTMRRRTACLKWLLAPTEKRLLTKEVLLGKRYFKTTAAKRVFSDVLRKWHK